MPDAIGFVSIGVLLLCNLTLAAYSFGKLSQRVSDLSRRVERLEHILNCRPHED